MTYAIIQPPFTLEFPKMPKAELEGYFQWYFDAIPERVGQLTEAVRRTEGFDNWQADKTPDSLGDLGEWFANQIETRRRTSEELVEIEAQLKYPVEVPDEQLTNRTFSLAMDVGMYFGQVMESNHPFVRWDQPFKDKKFIDYGQPVLVGNGRVPLNPVRIAVVLAYALARKTQSGGRLRELYDVWSKMLQGNK